MKKYIIISIWLLGVVAIFTVGKAFISGLKLADERMQRANEMLNKTSIKVTPNDTEPITKMGEPAKPATYPCAPLENVNSNIQVCNYPEKFGFDKQEIRFKSSVVVAHITKYAVAPNGHLIFAVTYSDDYIKTGGAPAENALYMINTSTGKATQLFSKILFVEYVDKLSWSPTRDGIVFTAGPEAAPYDLTSSDPFSVIYCSETSCKVLATDAGPIGIPGDPAYFENGKVKYTNKIGTLVTLDTNL